MIWVRKDLFEQVIISMVYNIRKISTKSGAQKPCRILRRMKAAKRCLSSAEVNPHQALAAYNSLAMSMAVCAYGYYAIIYVCMHI